MAADEANAGIDLAFEDETGLGEDRPPHVDHATQPLLHIEQLKGEPFRPHPGMNIDKVAGKQMPPAYRLKIGRIRIEYFVDGQMIVIFNIFMKKRKSDYR